MQVTEINYCVFIDYKLYAMEIIPVEKHEYERRRLNPRRHTIATKMRKKNDMNERHPLMQPKRLDIYFYLFKNFRIRY